MTAEDPHEELRSRYRLFKGLYLTSFLSFVLLSGAILNTLWDEIYDALFGLNHLFGWTELTRQVPYWPAWAVALVASFVLRGASEEAEERLLIAEGRHPTRRKR